MAPMTDAESLLADGGDIVNVTDRGSEMWRQATSRRSVGAISAIAVMVVVAVTRSSMPGTPALSTSNDVIGLQVATAVTLAAATEKAFVVLKPIANVAASGQVAGPAAAYMLARFRQFSPGATSTAVTAALEAKITQQVGTLVTYAGYTPAQAATLQLKPERMYLFEKTFGVSWAYANSQSKVIGAEKFIDLTAPNSVTTRDAFKTLWAALIEVGHQVVGNMVEIGPNLHCGKVKEHYVIGGEWVALKDLFTTAPAVSSVVVFDVPFDPAVMRWQDFLYSVIGSPDPAEAAPGSIVHAFFTRSVELGVTPRKFDTGIFVSQSPLEALNMRHAWAGAVVADDVFAKGLQAVGVPTPTLESWLKNPIVTIGGQPEGVFRQFAELNSAQCLAKAPQVLLR